MPGILFAATDAPTPLPQRMMPRSDFRRPVIARADGLGEVGVVDCGDCVERTLVDDVVSEAAQLVDDRLLDREPGVIGADRNAHR